MFNFSEQNERKDSSKERVTEVLPCNMEWSYDILRNSSQVYQDLIMDQQEDLSRYQIRGALTQLQGDVLTREALNANFQGLLEVDSVPERKRADTALSLPIWHTIVQCITTLTSIM